MALLWAWPSSVCVRAHRSERWRWCPPDSVANENAPTPVEEKKLQCNDIAIGAHDKTFEQIKNIEIAHDAWAKLEETFEGTKGTKTAKAY